jgi:hypothetical protein
MIRMGLDWTKSVDVTMGLRELWPFCPVLYPYTRRLRFARCGAAMGAAGYEARTRATMSERQGLMAMCYD